MKTKLHTCVEGLPPSHACSLVGSLVSVGPYGPRLVDYVGFLVMSLTSLALSILLSHCSIEFPKLCHGSLHLFPSVAG